MNSRCGITGYGAGIKRDITGYATKCRAPTDRQHKIQPENN